MTLKPELSTSLEPAAGAVVGYTLTTAEAIAFSQAISLKRIADAFEAPHGSLTIRELLSEMVERSR